MKAENVRRFGAWLLVLALISGPAGLSARAEDEDNVPPAEEIVTRNAPEATTAPEAEESDPEATPVPEMAETPVSEETKAPAETPEETEPGEDELPDPTADVETEADWCAALPKLTGRWEMDVLAVAESQLGVTASERNFELDADGGRHPYTRYGAWAGRPHEPWCAMFVSFCIYYAGIPTEALPRAFGCQFWAETLTEAGLYIHGEAAEGYTPEPGDLLFFAAEAGKVPTHAGIVKEYRPDENGDATLLTIEGNNGPAVREVERSLSGMTDCAVVGYVSLREARERWEHRRREENAEHTHAAAETMQITCLFEGEETSLWLILLPEAPVEGCNYTRSGEPFYYSELHKAWCLPLWSGDAPTADDLAEIPGAAVVLTNDGDINGTGKTDVNDAQYLYAILSGSLDPLSRPAAELVKADLDGNGRLEAEDAVCLSALGTIFPAEGDRSVNF